MSWNGKKKSAALVSIVVVRKSFVRPSTRFAVSGPPRTTIPERIANRLIRIWISV
jgi:hypothetical protein